METATYATEQLQIPERLTRISGPPKILYGRGAPIAKLLRQPCVAIVGSRKVTSYGARVTHDIGKALASCGITIISGLALGVDALAHQAALEADGATIAVLPCYPNRIYPASNYGIGLRILRQGGALVSEYGPSDEMCYKSNFIARNRLISGLANAVLITEAAIDSGSLHTAHFALEQGKEVLAVPGPINGPMSAGTNNLIKTGAHLVTSAEEVLHILGVPRASSATKTKGSTPEEQCILDLMDEGITGGEALLTLSALPVSGFSQALTMLEITGKVRSLGANNWAPT